LEPIIATAYNNGCNDDDLAPSTSNYPSKQQDLGQPPLDMQAFAKKYLKMKKLIPGSIELYATTRELYSMETDVNELMHELFFTDNNSPRPCSMLSSITSEELDIKISDLIDDFQSKRGIKFLPAQLEAIRGCCINQLGVIIGQPGTGKSTIAECITDCLYSLGCRHISLTAISGQAVGQIKSKCAMVRQRDEKLCGTIDKLLFTVYPSIGHGEQPSIIIIDEFSMVDIHKWLQLLKYIQKFKCQVILIGDAYQLPSIGAGQLLATICQYPDVYQVFQLLNIIRQTGHLSNVIHRMTTETITNNDFNKLDFIHEDFDGGAQTAEFISSLVDRYGLTKDNTRFLCSQSGGSSGIISINRILQNIYNQFGDDLPRLYSAAGGGRKNDISGDGYQNFRVGDLVIRRTNDYFKNVEQGIIYLNGDCGILTRFYNMAQQRVDPKLYQIDYYNGGTPIISGNPIKSELVTLEELHENFTVGYALSVHRAQGSQYENIVILMTTDQKFMWTNPQCDGFNLLYTAISRASQRCIIAGKYGYFLDSQRARTRKTGTPKRLSICCHPKYMFKSVT
jgi:exodeoxyribonuclease V alpha subunit